MSLLVLRLESLALILDVLDLLAVITGADVVELPLIPRGTRVSGGASALCGSPVS